jgi:hypothetical protein
VIRVVPRCIIHYVAAALCLCIDALSPHCHCVVKCRCPCCVFLFIIQLSLKSFQLVVGGCLQRIVFCAVSPLFMYFSWRICVEDGAVCPRASCCGHCSVF